MWPTQSNIEHNYDYKKIVSACLCMTKKLLQQVGNQGNTQNRQSDIWVDGLEESSNSTNQVKKWKGGWMCVLRALVLGPASVDKACLVNWTCCSDMEPFFLYRYTTLQVIDMHCFSAPGSQTGMLCFGLPNMHYFSATCMLCFVLPDMQLLQCSRHAMHQFTKHAKCQ